MTQSVNRFPHKREDTSWIQEIVSKTQMWVVQAWALIAREAETGRSLGLAGHLG